MKPQGESAMSDMNVNSMPSISPRISGASIQIPLAIENSSITINHQAAKIQNQSTENRDMRSGEAAEEIIISTPATMIRV